MKYFLILLITGCATAPNPQVETMKTCKSLCRSTVTKYIDDTVDCECQLKGDVDAKSISDHSGII